MQWMLPLLSTAWHCWFISELLCEMETTARPAEVRLKVSDGLPVVLETTIPALFSHVAPPLLE